MRKYDKVELIRNSEDNSTTDSSGEPLIVYDYNLVGHQSALRIDHLQHMHNDFSAIGNIVAHMRLNDSSLNSNCIGTIS